MATLVGKLDEGMNTLHVQQMAVWKAVTCDILHPRVQHDGALEGELTHRDKTYKDALTPAELPPGSYVFDRSFCRACGEENDAERAARDKVGAQNMIVTAMHQETIHHRMLTTEIAKFVKW